MKRRLSPHFPFRRPQPASRAELLWQVQRELPALARGYRTRTKLRRLREIEAQLQRIERRA